MKKVPKERKMTLVEAPEKITYPILQKHNMDLSPFYEGADNGIDLVCGSCHLVLNKNVRIVSLPILAIYQCPQCAQLNTL
ncbi:hypothetical protein [Paenibacillus sp. PvR053]